MLHLAGPVRSSRRRRSSPAMASSGLSSVPESPSAQGVKVPQKSAARPRRGGVGNRGEERVAGSRAASTPDSADESDLSDVNGHAPVTRLLTHTGGSGRTIPGPRCGSAQPGCRQAYAGFRNDRKALVAYPWKSTAFGATSRETTTGTTMI